MTVRIRAGRREDAESALSVWQLANTARRGGEAAPDDQGDRVRTALALPDAFLVVAEHRGALVGMALGMHARADDGAGAPIAGRCHISMVFVHPSRWSRGIGTRLTRRLLVEAAARGYREAQLWTHADNERAQRLYQQLGFVRSGREKTDQLGEPIVHYQLSWSTLPGLSTPF